MISKLVIEYIPLGDLMPNRYNHNNHSAESFDLLINSLKLFGFTQPIVAQRSTKVIIDGEHRTRAASVLGYDEVPVVFLDLNDEEMMLATIIHNRSRGSENSELICKIYDALEQKKFDTDKYLLRDRQDTYFTNKFNLRG